MSTNTCLSGHFRMIGEYEGGLKGAGDVLGQQFLNSAELMIRDATLHLSQAAFGTLLRRAAPSRIILKEKPALSSGLFCVRCPSSAIEAPKQQGWSPQNRLQDQRSTPDLREMAPQCPRKLAIVFVSVPLASSSFSAHTYAPPNPPGTLELMYSIFSAVVT